MGFAFASAGLSFALFDGAFAGAAVFAGAAAAAFAGAAAAFVGAAGTFTIGVLVFGDPNIPIRWVGVALILLGVIFLKMG